MSNHTAAVSCFRTTVAAMAIAVLFIPNAHAQNLETATIRGHVVDSSGAVIAGAEVAATSPALLVPQITVRTDSLGEYKFSDLPIGSYRVTYRDPGFQQLVRENILLTAGFTATVDVRMQVGSASESVTVTSEAPVVDTTQTTTGTDLNSEILTDVIPTTRNAVEYLATTPGVTRANRPDFGGGTSGGGQYDAYGIQGQMTMLLDGVNTTQSVINQGTGNGPDLSSLDEMQVVAISGTAETANPGILLNLIVKSGGNQFHGRYESTGETSGLQGNNLTPQLIAEHFTVAQAINSYETANADLGGPIIKDKLWFYGAYAFQHGDRTALGFLKYPSGTNIYNLASATGTTADLTSRLQNETGKVTYQISQNYKLIGLLAWHTELFNPYPTGPSSLSPYENNPEFHWNPHQMKLEMQATPTPRLVIDALIGRQAYLASYTPEPGVAAAPEVLDVTTQQYLGPSMNRVIRPRRSIGPAVTVSYFPGGSFLGTHELKTGVNYYWQTTSTIYADAAPNNYLLEYTNVNSVPTPYEAVTWNLPTNAPTYQNQGGWFVQDAWHPGKRLTVNLGLRVDHYATGLPEVTRQAGQFASAATYPAMNTGSWTNLAPRAGVAWNVSGDNKTVLRASYGWFNHAVGDDFAGIFSQSGVATQTYTWNAPVGSTVLGSNQLGALVSQTGGSLEVLNPKLREPHTNELMAGVERQIAQNTSIRVNYTWVKQIDLFGNYNILRPYSAWSVPYTTYPNGNPIVDPGPSGTGASGPPITIWGYPAQYASALLKGPQNEYVAYPNSSAPIFKILDVIVTRRLTGKLGITTSVTWVRDHQPSPSSTLAGFGTYLAAIPVSPNSNYFNYDRTWNWQAKSTIYYNLPWKIVASSTFEGYNGVRGQRLVNFTGIGSPNIGTITVPMDPYGSVNGPVRLLWNVEVGREFIFGERMRLKPSVDILNFLNRADQWAINFTSGPSYLYPTTIDTPRIARFAMSFSF